MNKGRRLRRAHESYKGEGRAREERKPKLAVVVVELCSDRQRMGRLCGVERGQAGWAGGGCSDGLKSANVVALTIVTCYTKFQGSSKH